MMAHLCCVARGKEKEGPNEAQIASDVYAFTAMLLRAGADVNMVDQVRPCAGVGPADDVPSCVCCCFCSARPFSTPAAAPCSQGGRNALMLVGNIWMGQEANPDPVLVAQLLDVTQLDLKAKATVGCNSLVVLQLRLCFE